MKNDAVFIRLKSDTIIIKGFLLKILSGLKSCCCINANNPLIIIASDFNQRKWVLIFLISCIQPLFAQKFTQRQAIERAWQQNPTIKIASLEADAQRFLVGTAAERPKTYFEGGFGRIQNVGDLDYSFSISQAFSHPKYYRALGDLLNKQVSVIEQNQAIKKNELAFRVKQVFAKLGYYQAIKNILMVQDSIYKKAKELAVVRRQAGEDSNYEVVTAESELADNEVRMQLVLVEEKQLFRQLEFLLNLPKSEKIDFQIDNLLNLEILPNGNLSIENNPMLLQYNLQKTAVESQISLENTKKLPDFFVNLTNQSIDHKYTPMYLLGGVSIPLSSKSYKARTQSLRVNELAVSENQNMFRKELEIQLENQLMNIEKGKILKTHFEQTAFRQDKYLYDLTYSKYKSGQALYIEYIIAMQKAWKNKEKYLQNLLDLKQSINEIEFLTGKDL